ncbi:MAG: murein biosynthesis integral membrane protein MurJ [Phycisphaerales bacterium]|nr:murein biosynthesis integral membrane protein MurJ [Phycisphaerales bacterium]
MARHFEFHARTVSALTFVSRVTGLARDAAMSRVFGAGAVTDAFAFAFMVPNLFRRLFGEGALTSSFLPVYAKLEEKEPAVAAALARMVLARVAVFLAVVCLIGEGVLLLCWPSGANDAATLSAKLVAILLPYMPLVCLVALIGAILQVHHRFGPTAAAPIILNVAIVATCVGLMPQTLAALGFAAISQHAHVMMVASSVIVAGVLQVAWSWHALRSVAVEHADERTAASRAFSRVILQAVPMALGLGVLQVNTFVDGLIASYPTIVGPTVFGIEYPLKEGAMASLSFAQRLYEFPLGVFGISVATAIFPQLSREAHDTDAFRATLARALRLVMFVGLPASVGLMMLRIPLTAAVFQGDSFTEADTARVASILLAFAPAIWAYSANHVLTRAFYARGEPMTPVIVAVAMVALNFLLNITLIWTPLNTAGLALSTATCSIIQMVILQRLLAKRVGPLVTGEVVTSWWRSAFVTAVMGVVLLGAMQFTPEKGSWFVMLSTLLLLVAVGAATALGAARMLRMTELRWALGRR